MEATSNWHQKNKKRVVKRELTPRELRDAIIAKDALTEIEQELSKDDLPVDIQMHDSDDEEDHHGLQVEPDADSDYKDWMNWNLEHIDLRVKNANRKMESAMEDMKRVVCYMSRKLFAVTNLV